MLLAAAGPTTTVNKALDRVRGFLGQELGEIDTSAHRLLWVTDFPLFELNEEEQRLEVRGPLKGRVRPCRLYVCRSKMSTPQWEGS